MPLSAYVYQRVSNPIARQVLEAVYGVYENRLRDGDASNFILPQEQLVQLRQRLATSNIAQMLAEGAPMVDLYDRCHPVLKPYYMLTRPRTHRQLARSVANNLNCYLDLQSRPPLPSGLLMFSVLAIWGLVYLVSNYGHLLGWSIPPATSMGVITLSIVLATAFLSLLLYANFSYYFSIARAKVLFEYLFASYSDPPEDELEIVPTDSEISPVETMHGSS